MRLVRPSLLVFAVAVLASLSIHLPVYKALGDLADVLLHSPASKASPRPVQFEILDNPDPTKKDEPKPEEPAKPPEQLAKAELKPKPKEEHKELVKPKPKPEPPKIEVPVQQVPVEPIPQPQDSQQPKHAITQKSDDPNVAPPDNPRFIAEENRRVEEESVANQRTTAEVDEQPAAQARARDQEMIGNADQEDVADLQDVHGEDSRNPTAKEAREKPPSPSKLGQGEKQDPAVAQAPKQGGSEAREEQKREVAAGSEHVGGEEEALVINDGSGSIRIRRAPQGRGAGDGGGEPQRGSRGAASRDQGAVAGASTNLKLSWSQFESTFGSEELKKQRDAYLEQRRTQAKGGRNEEQWKKFRAAVENYVDQVKPGNQTALNAAASPFAAYLAAIHRNIHREFAMKFLRSLPLLGGPFADPNLRTRLAIVINQDGTLHQVGVIQTSGFTPYDFGAWNAVTKAAPFPEAPKKILSGDGRVYVHWDFYNNERQCGTFNAEPYILPMPDRKTPPSPGPLHDNYDSPGKGKLGRAPEPVPPEQRLSRFP
ncbi:MAG TPA: TonB C-terminal domain-containing protein [Polyangiales bacterium]|nr:TonB C-terminal domain-containing protein [Polyangiales bacterium]